jgi:hypothetical protein
MDLIGIKANCPVRMFDDRIRGSSSAKHADQDQGGRPAKCDIPAYCAMFQSILQDRRYDSLDDEATEPLLLTEGIAGDKSFASQGSR